MSGDAGDDMSDDTGGDVGDSPGGGLFSLAGRTALVTGSSRGIGRAIATGLGRAGARVILNGRDRGALGGALAAHREAGLAGEALVFDVADRESVNAAIEDAENRFGPIDVLVNNAGIQRRGPLAEIDPEVWQEVIDVNLNGVFHVGQALGRRMVERGRGKIINIASLMSEVGRPTTGPYTAAKGGVKMLTRAMCVEWARHNVQVNAIGPGYFATELNQALIDDPQFNEFICNRTPAGRWGEVDELIGAAVFLASSASNYVNGQVIYVDGGLLAAI